MAGFPLLLVSQVAFGGVVFECGPAVPFSLSGGGRKVRGDAPELRRTSVNRWPIERWTLFAYRVRRWKMSAPENLD
jgi:hypothetical protein